jgi:hypothetical protein
MTPVNFTGGNNTPCRRNEIKNFTNEGIPDSLSYYMIPAPFDDAGMNACCGANNPVRRNDDCTVWCEIPRDFFTTDNPGPMRDVGATVHFEFDKCLRNITGKIGFPTVAYIHLNETDRKESAAAAVGPAAVPGLGRLLLMAGVVYLVLF